MRRKSPFMTVVVPLIALGMLIFAVSSAWPEKEPPPPTIQNPPPAAEFAARIAGIGVTEPQSENIAIGTPIAGIVESVGVQVGDRVEKDQLLFALDTRDVFARLEASRAQLSSARVEAEEASRQWEIIKSIADKRAVSESERTRVQHTMQLTAARVKQAEAEVKVLDTELKRLTITAPIDGTVLKVNVRPGEFAPAGEVSPPLMVLGNIDVMHVRVEFDESDALRIDSEAKAAATLRGYPDRKVELSFVRREPLLKPKGNLSGTDARVDTRVQEFIYAFENAELGASVGQQMDVFVEAK